MKTIVIYRSKAGFAKKYAQWIAEELEADLLEASEADASKWAAYDTIVYGGGLYAAGINGVKLIKQNLDSLKGKKVIVYACGASPLRQGVINEVRNKNFTEEQQRMIRFYYLRGGFDYSRLRPLDKFLMTLLKRTLKRKKVKTPDERGMLESYDHPVDFTDRKNIAELIEYAKS